MARISTVSFTGISGKEYEFNVYHLGVNFNAIGAVYAITLREQNASGEYNHTIIYIGESGDLSDRFDSHHKADCFNTNSANCICIHADDNKDSRLEKEQDLIENYEPPCND